jgi:hypothetical protein
VNLAGAARAPGPAIGVLKMSEDGRIYVSAAQPATLLDGAEVTECPTLHD